MNTLRQESERCLKCKNPSCSASCPVHTPVPEVMNLLLDGKIQEAGQVLFTNNPLSAITSIVCPHEQNCFGHCVLGSKGEPVEFYRIEQYVSDYYLCTLKIPVVPKNGKKVAVIGAGPAGLTAALKLSENGYDVTIFEAEDGIGGVLRYGIPNFRLQKDILTPYRKILDLRGVKVRLNMSFGTPITSQDLFRDGYLAVFVAIGVGSPNILGIPGETFGNVHYAIDYLKSPERYFLGEKVIVIGTGNVAMDTARTAIRKNHSNVIMLNWKDKDGISASSEELELALMDGVQILNNTHAVEIKDDKLICVTNSQTETGEEISSEPYEIPADSVILAIGQGPHAELRYGPLDVTNRGLIEVDEYGETSQKNIWAAGDIVTGATTVVQAVANALHTVQCMMDRLEQM